MKNKFVNSLFIKKFGDACANMYRQGWDERNGGNISWRLEESEIRKYFKKDIVIRKIPLGFTAASNVRNQYFLVTGTGKYFKNVQKEPENSLGLVKISSDGNDALLIWGFADGGKFTSEFPSHLMSHSTRLDIDPKTCIVLHTHPTYTICMGACCPTDEIELTRRLWKSNTEAVVVFPEGVGVLPCMLCGTNDIGVATAEKMKNFRVVSWTNHGIYGTGSSMDEAFGLVETVEKTAEIYMLSLGHVVNEIPDEVIIGLKNLWNLKTLKGVIKGLDD